MMIRITTTTKTPASAIRRALGVIARPRVQLGGFTTTTLDPHRRSPLL